MTDPNTSIVYRFTLAGGTREEVALRFDRRSFVLQLDDQGEPEPWTELGFHQCGHCPLTADTTRQCPFARAMAAFIHQFERFYSYEKTVVEVVTERRTMVARQALQHGMASLIGLIGATSGCPHLAFFRPMARFHLPFASAEETLYRAFSTWLLRECLLSHSPPDLAGLDASYQAAAAVNKGMADRIRGAFDKDAVVNAIVVLDTFAQAGSFVIEENLEELRYIFGL